MLRLLERRFKVRAPVTKAWTHLQDVERWPTWATHIRRVELKPPGALRADSEGTIRLTNGITSTFRMEELREGASWKWAGPFLWITVHYDHRFKALGTAESEIEFVLDGEGAAVGSLGRVFAVIYARNLDRAIPRLVAEIEGLP
jgi:polyketide cyclase/dehydrase/lipid transport protein